MKISHKDSYNWFAVVASFMGGVLVLNLPAPYDVPELVVAWVGGIWAWCFANQQRHAEDTRFMRELMKDFSERYDGMNEDLQCLLRQQTPFTPEQEMKVIDYFNLCADEWFFRKRGYVDDDLWQNWLRGMEQYSKDPRVRELWLREEKTDSYYDLPFPIKN